MNYLGAELLALDRSYGLDKEKGTKTGKKRKEMSLLCIDVPFRAMNLAVLRCGCSIVSNF